MRGGVCSRAQSHESTVWVTVVVLYLMGALAIAFVCPSDHPDLSMQSDMAIESPFVIAIRIAGIRVLPSVIVSLPMLASTCALLIRLAERGLAPQRNLCRQPRPLHLLSGTVRSGNCGKGTSDFLHHDCERTAAARRCSRRRCLVSRFSLRKVRGKPHLCCEPLVDRLACALVADIGRQSGRLTQRPCLVL